MLAVAFCSAKELLHHRALRSVLQAVSMRKHLELNRKDKDGKFRLILVESRIHRLARYYRVRPAVCHADQPMRSAPHGSTSHKHMARVCSSARSILQQGYGCWPTVRWPCPPSPVISCCAACTMTRSLTSAGCLVSGSV
jgi:hypothetical protein